MWLKRVLLGVFAVSSILTGVMVYGVRRWKTATEKLRTELEAGRLHIGPKTYSEDELVGLPAPAVSYTHLDVYKRQEATTALARDRRADWESAAR